MAELRIALLALGRDGALGERRRIEAWVAIGAVAGVDVEVIRLTTGRRPHLEAAQLASTLRGTAVPEHHAWSLRAVRARLRAVSPDAVVCLTTRAFHPALADEWPVVLDLVDSLGDSYAQRASQHPSMPTRAAYRALSLAQRRIERRVAALPVIRAVAGHADAERFAAHWLPNVVTDLPPDGPESNPDHDLVFFGSLGYPPNVAAIEQLHAWWPQLLERRPQTSLLVAGARPTAAVRRMATERGWTLEEDFAHVTTLCRRARLAVAPLPQAAGFQNKVLEAAIAGVAQVVSPAVARGLDPGFPVDVADGGDVFVGHVVHLLDDGAMRAALAAEARAHVLARYQPTAHAGIFRELGFAVDELVSAS